MAIKESALSLITSIAQGDWVRAVTSAGASRRVTVANLAKAIVESYTGSSLAGSAQSVKSAIDSLNSKTEVTVTASANVVIDTNKSYKCGNILFLNVKGHATATLSSASLFVFAGASVNPNSFTFGIPVGAAWDVTDISYGYINANGVVGRIASGQYFHIAQAFICS